MASAEGAVDGSDNLFKSVSSLLWFLRLIGATPLYHDGRRREIVVFHWFHPQTFWFIFFTIVHLSFNCAQIFGGVFGIGIDYRTPTAAATSWISKIGFFVTTFVVPKLMLFHFVSLKIFFAEINKVFDPISFSLAADVKRVKQFTAIGIALLLAFLAVHFVTGVHGIFEHNPNDSTILLTGKVIDGFIHEIGLLQFNMIGLQFSLLCYMIGLYLSSLTDLLNETVVREHTIIALVDVISGPKTQIHPEATTSRDGSNEPPALSETLSSLPLVDRLQYFKSTYLTVRRAVCLKMNRVFGFSVLLFLIFKLIEVTVTIYRQMDMFSSGKCVFLFNANMFFISDLIAISILFQATDFLHAKANHFLAALNAISTKGMSDSEREQVQLFIIQTRGEKVRLSACGLFKLGKHLFPSIVGTVATYFLVLLQFSASERTDSTGGTNSKQ